MKSSHKQPHGRKEETLHLSYLTEAHNPAVAKAPSQKGRLPPDRQSQPQTWKPDQQKVKKNVESFSVPVNEFIVY